MRILYINSILIDIDDNTAIGIDLQVYDVKEPAKNKIKVSNAFSIPITNNNLEAIGFIGRHLNTSNTIYGELICDYYVNNTQFIKQAKVRIEEIGERISLYVFDRPTIWDTLKTVKWDVSLVGGFCNGFYEWLNVPKFDSQTSGVTFTDFLDDYIALGGSNGVFLPFSRPNELSGVAGALDITLSISPFFNQSGGAFFSFIKSVFEYIEDTYSVQFYTGSTFDYNLFNDVEFKKELWHFRQLCVAVGDDGLYFDFDNSDFFPAENYCNTFRGEETKDKTLYDFVIAVLKKYNVVVTEFEGGYRFRRFDDMANLSPIDFSGGFTGVPIFKPSIDGYTQNNTIKFKTVETGINPLTNSRVLTCLNENLEVKSDLFEIDAFIAGLRATTVAGLNAVNLATPDSFKAFKFYTTGDQLTDAVTINIPANSAAKTGLYNIGLYSLASEYTLLDSAIKYPVYFEDQKWMTALEIQNFDFFNQYFIRELGGSYFVNKIKGFNPDKSRQATTLELFKISNKAPANEISGGIGSMVIGTTFTIG